MRTGLDRIADKSRSDSNLRFTSLAHHLSEEMIWRSLCKTTSKSSPGVDGQDVSEAKNSFKEWVEEMISSVHRRCYKAPPVRRVYIPKPGKSAVRPIGVPTITDRALQRSVSKILSSIYEQDFLKCSFGGREGLSAHNALCTFNKIVSARKTSWVFEADLKDFFGSIDHGWLLRFVELRVGDPRMLRLIRCWLKAGVMEDGKYSLCEKGTPQGGSISVLLSNIYLHYVLDLWFEKVVKPRLKGEAYLVRYLDDFLVCFQYRSDAHKFKKALVGRLTKFSLSLEPSKTDLVEFGRFAAKNAKKYNEKLKTVYFLGFTHYCTKRLNGEFRVGRKTDKDRVRRTVAKLREVTEIIRHKPLQQQAIELNWILRGHYAYYGLGGNYRSLKRIYRLTERLWRKALSRRSQRGHVTWGKFRKIKAAYPLQQPRLYIPFDRMSDLAVL